MSKTTIPYETIAERLIANGITTDSAYEILAQANFSVTVDGQLYTGIFASRVIAIMHQLKECKPLEL
jgi:hypothetical protein